MDLEKVPPLYSFLPNHLSSPVLVLPVPSPSLPLSFCLSLSHSFSLSPELLIEMDIMRQGHAGREMGGSAMKERCRKQGEK